MKIQTTKQGMEERLGELEVVVEMVVGSLLEVITRIKEIEGELERVEDGLAGKQDKKV